MKTWNARLALAGMLVVAAGSAAAEVAVKFSHTEGYGNLTSVPQYRERVFQDLTAYFDKLGATLPAGTKLQVEVLELAMAGPIMPASSRNGEAPRMASGEAYWPHMHLRYTVTQGGKVIAQGDDQLTDPDYTNRVRRVATTYPAEKLMIDDWFKANIADRQLAAR